MVQNPSENVEFCDFPRLNPGKALHYPRQNPRQNLRVYPQVCLQIRQRNDGAIS